MEYKTESNKWANKKNKQTKTHRHKKQHRDYQRAGTWGVDKGKVKAQVYGDRRWSDFGLWGHNAIYR